MKRTAIIVGGAATLVLAVAIFAISSHKNASEPMADAPAAAPTVTADPEASGSATSPRFDGWETWSTSRRTALVADLMGDPRLDADTIAFLKRQLEDRKLDPGTRNNVANALMGQERRPDGLAAVFLRMVDDPQETMTWREYAVQRLVATLSPDEDARPMAARLVHLVQHGDGPLPGSALIQLELLVLAGRGDAGPAYAQVLVALAKKPDAPLENRMTAVAKLGETGDRSQAAVVRALLTADAAPALIRVSVATLGLIGAPEDQQVVQRYLKHPNRAVVMAAKAAIKRLEARAAL